MQFLQSLFDKNSYQIVSFNYKKKKKSEQFWVTKMKKKGKLKSYTP